MKKVLSVLLILVMIFTFAACGNSGNGGDAGSDEIREMTINVGGTVAESHPISLGLMAFEKYVEEASDGKMQVECHYNGALGAGRELVESLMLGNMQMCEVTSSEVGDQMRQNVLDKTGVRTLIFFENGVRHITNNVRPITCADDMKGIKIRVMENDVYIKMMELLDALPTPMSVTELFTALQTHSVDAQENPWVNTLTYGFGDVQKYVSNSAHTFDATTFNANDEWYQSLTDAEKAIIDEGAKRGAAENRAQSQALDESSLQELIDKYGMEYYEMSDEELQTFRDKCEPLQDWFVNESGIETVTSLQTVMDKIAELEAAQAN